MALRVVWTDEAIKELKTITYYLEQHWTEKELNKFYNILEQQIALISQHPKAFHLIGKKDVRASVLAKQTTIFYTLETDLKQIRIQSVFDTRQDPEKLNFVD